ncbi:heat shock 22 kDa protein, mitochondrial-like [Papaver somniferum]|uniref:heat shock 22 kDa protein, mitochondrial-like n=1 Tax=Papaver somniferum TaxID=3469 RepID=UPI000E6FADAB|nr:heat shock 22 kDa protein, mitochondrial-like [Papaver somniferum]
MASIFMDMSKKPAPTVVSSNTLKNKLGLLKNPNPKRSAASFVPIYSFPLNMMKNKKGSHTTDVLRPSFTTDLLSSDVFDSDMEEVKLYDKEEKDVMMKRWSAKELKEGIQLKINLPGFGKDDIKVTVEGTSLVITTLLGKEEDDVLVVGPDVNEYDMNTFITFNLDLDFLNLQELKAEMKNGLLKISIPKEVEEKDVILVKVE